jgi:uncharacterized membrane protein YeaQ/YmgE (transglycosylase-associated protein family)
MEIIILIVVMVIVGVIMGYVAGQIWKDDSPLGQQGNMVVSIVTCVLVGLLDWYVIPAMGFSDTLKYVGVAMEPALGALLVLWLIRRARQ